jgi:hypothetical protein
MKEYLYITDGAGIKYSIGDDVKVIHGDDIGLYGKISKIIENDEKIIEIHANKWSDGIGGGFRLEHIEKIDKKNLKNIFVTSKNLSHLIERMNKGKKHLYFNSLLKELV